MAANAIISANTASVGHAEKGEKSRTETPKMNLIASTFMCCLARGSA